MRSRRASERALEAAAGPLPDEVMQSAEIDYDQFTEVTRHLCLYWAGLSAPVPPRR